MLSNCLKNPYINSLIILFALAIPTLTTKHIFLKGALMVYTGFLPFINAVIWLSFSNTGKVIFESLKTRHWAIIFSWFVLVYTIYAKQWASGYLNEIFHVDPNNFEITYILLAFLFTPAKLLFQQSIIGYLYAAFLILSMLLSTFGLLYLFMNASFSFRKIALAVTYFFFGIMVFSFVITVASNITYNFKGITIDIALWADFKTSHLCLDSWALDAQSVAFIDADKVLVFFPENKEGEQFRVENCDLKRRF